MRLNAEDMCNLFLSVVENSTRNNDAANEVFSLFVRTTLDYRDQILAFEGIVVTVEDVRSTLDWLVASFDTGRLPLTTNAIRLGLLRLWLDELRAFGNPHAHLS